MRMVIMTAVMLLMIGANAQDPQAREKIESARIALITERLGLTPEQAEKFWPIYREFSQKQEAVRREFAEAKRNFNTENATEEENKRLLELGMKTKERQLQLEREYSDRFLQVINNRQLLSLRKAEEDFRNMLIQRLQQQRERQEQLREQQRRNQDLQQKRRGN
jgi:hypothetical protein